VVYDDMLMLLLTVAMAAQAIAPPPPAKTFEAVSIRKREGGAGGTTIRPLGGFVAPNLPIRALINMAYGLRNVQLVGGPDWIRSDRYDILARADSTPPEDELMLMLQAMLADRFKLKAHRETREVQGYRLVQVHPGRLGPKLQPGADCALKAARPNGPCGITYNGPSLTFRGSPIANLLGNLEAGAGGPVIDTTGLSGLYDFELRWAEVRPGEPPSDLPNLFTALQEQLGLKLEPSRVTLEVLVIDSIARPTEN
jgi:uncharacterized protein (TIGR03435 family)